MTTVTAIVPSAGKIGMDALMSAFPGLGKSLGSYLGHSPSLPSSGKISMVNFRGLTAPTPATTSMATPVVGTFLSVSINGSVTGSVSPSSPGSLSFDVLKLIIVDASQHGSYSFSISTGSLPTGFSLSPAGLLTATALQSSISSSATVKIVNVYGNYCYVPLTFNVTANTAPTPSAAANPIVFSTYDGSKYPVTWSFIVSNCVTCVLYSTAGFSGTPVGSLVSNVYTVTGFASPVSTPSVTLSLTNAITGYTTSTASPVFVSSTSSPSMPYDTMPTASSGANYYGTYNGSTYPVTWTFSVANANLVSINSFSSFSGTPTGSLSGNVYTLTGFVTPNAQPSVNLSFSDVVSGYLTSVANYNFAASSAAPAVPSAPTPSSSTGSVYYGSYNGSSYSVTWSISVSNSTSVSITSYSGFSATPSGTLSGSTYTVTSYVAPSSTPYVALSLTNTVSGYTTSYSSSSFYAPGSSPAAPYSTTPTSSAGSINYGASSGSGTFYVTWSFNVYNTTSAYISTSSSFAGTPWGSLSGNVYTVNGYVLPNSYPLIGLVLTNTVSGYNSSQSAPQYSASQISPAADATATASSVTYGAYTNDANYAYPITWTFNVSNVSSAYIQSFSTFVYLNTPSGTLSGNTYTVTGLVPVSSQASVTLHLTNSSGSSVSLPFTASTPSPAAPAAPSAPTPSASAGTPTFSSYNGSMWSVSWTFNATNAIMMGVSSTNVSSFVVSGYTLTGYISPLVTPTCSMIFVNSISGYTDSQVTLPFTGSSSSPDMPYSTTPTASANSATYGAYNGSTYPITWTFNIGSTTLTSVSSTNITSASMSGNTLTGYITQTTIPSCTLYLQNVVSGYKTNFYYPAFTDVASPSSIPLAPAPNIFQSGNPVVNTYLSNMGGQIPIQWSFSWNAAYSYANFYNNMYQGACVTNGQKTNFIVSGWISPGTNVTFSIDVTNTVSGYANNTKTLSFVSANTF